MTAWPASVSPRAGAAATLGGMVVLRWRRQLAPVAVPAVSAAAGAVAAVAALTGWLLAEGVPDALAQQAVAVTIAITLIIPLVAAALAVIAGCAGADLTPQHRTLLVAPVATRVLVLALAAPGLLVAAAVATLLNPPAVVVLTELTGYGVAHAIATVSIGTAIGLLAGRLIVVVVRACLSSNSWLSQYLTTTALTAWLAVSVASIVLVRDRLGAGVLDQLAGGGWRSVQLATGWPALLAWSLRPRPAAAAAALAAVGVLALAVWWTAAWRASAGVVVAARARCRVVWQDGTLGHVRLAVHRILRHRKTLSWTATSAVILLAMSGYLLTLSPDTARSLSANAVLLTAQLAAYQALLCRGMDRVENPVPLLYGMSVRSYCAAWQSASAAIAFVLAAPVLLMLWAATGHADVAVSGLFMVAAAVAAAQALSSVLVTRPGDSGAETLAGALLFASLIGTGLLSSRVLGTTDLLPVAAGQLVLLGGAVMVPTAVEHRRGRRLRSIAAAQSQNAPRPALVGLDGRK